MTTPKAAFVHRPGQLDATLQFIKRTRFELRDLRRVHVWPDKLHILDINHDYFEITGVGYPDPDIVPILQAMNTAFDPTTIHAAAPTEYKDLETGRRYPWAHDRVL